MDCKFQNLGGAVALIATQVVQGRITVQGVKEEIGRLQAKRQGCSAGDRVESLLAAVLGEKGVQNMDLFDRTTLAKVVAICRTSGILAGAGRLLFNVLRRKIRSRNDSGWLRKCLAKFDLDWQLVS